MYGVLLVVTYQYKISSTCVLNISALVIGATAYPVWSSVIGSRTYIGRFDQSPTHTATSTFFFKLHGSTRQRREPSGTFQACNDPGYSARV